MADLFRKTDDPVSVKLDTVEDMLRPLPPGVQEDIVCLMMDVARTVKKRREHGM